VRRLPLALLVLALAGCESTQERSAKLRARAHHLSLASSGLRIGRTSTQATVVGAIAIEGSEGAAVAVTVRNRSSRPLHEVPIAVTVTDGAGNTLYRNDTPGLEAALTTIPSLAPHETLTWVDDQVPKLSAGGRASAVLGEAPASSAGVPALAVSAMRQIEDPANGIGTSATVVNSSPVAQRTLVVYAVARSGTRIVAAGRAVIPEVPARASAPVQVYWVGDVRGARIELRPSPSTFG
jgi:hypothetical protein